MRRTVSYEENIVDSIESRHEEEKKQFVYKSYLKKDYVDINQKKKSKYATMGPEKYPPPNPKNYLRKYAKTKNLLKEKPKPLVIDMANLKPQIDSRRPMAKKQKTKNFIKNNITEIKESKPAEPKQYLVLTRNGDKVSASYLVPYYVYSENFARKPRYLAKLNKIIEQKKQEMEDLKTLNEKTTNCRYMPRSERDTLLRGLKQNWDEKQKEFQLLPMITDTIPKINRKLKIEKELLELENDIRLIEKHPYIYIFDE